ncbi:Intraflagellar transport protein 20 [Xenoophorus captivus]|uniref:Intraflagellar transport protein 20 n=2 Tax=Goodeidae TaxID=28758 RepID=A0ABV0QS03_9TELE
MAKDPLAEAGFYFDELNKLRVLEPEVSQKTSELKEECKEFVDSKRVIFFPDLKSVLILCRFFSAKHKQLTKCPNVSAEIGQFQKIVGGLIEMVDELAKEAETEKMKAIGARNLLKSVAKQREAQQQQLQALIAEKKMQLERYRIEYEALSKVESEQNEFIDQFILQK